MPQILSFLYGFCTFLRSTFCGSSLPLGENFQQTSSMSLAEEKKLVKEIEQLKQSKKTAAQYVSQEEVRRQGKGTVRGRTYEISPHLQLFPLVGLMVNF